MDASADAQRYLLDTYLDWARAEGPPLIEGAIADIDAIDLAPWPRAGDGVYAAFLHLAGRGDFLAAQVIDLAPGAATRTSRHLFDEIYCVLSGEGRIEITAHDGAREKRTFRAHDVFSPSPDARYSIVNESPAKPARLVCVANLPFMMNLFRAEAFLFDGVPDRPCRSQDRPSLVFHSPFDAAPKMLGQNYRELAPPNSILHAHVLVIPPGAASPARRHGAGTHVLPLSGAAYSAIFRDAASEFDRVDWRAGLVLAPTDDNYVQHFNVGTEPARCLVLSLGGRQRPLLEHKAARHQSPAASLLDRAHTPPGLEQLFQRERARASGWGPKP